MALIGAAGALTGGMKALAADQAEAAADGPAVGRKFYPDGRVMPFSGNTIICHLPQQGPASSCFNAILDIYRDLPKYRFARDITLTPPSSYHMTVFAGANDRDRYTDCWPVDLPKSMAMDECNRILAERLQKAKFDIGLPLRMRIDQEYAAHVSEPLSIRLQPYDEAENAKIRTLRNRLADCLRIHTADHATYRFHVTMAYLVKPMSRATADEFRPLYAAWHRRLAERCPVIDLGAPEYCVFKDMFAFERQFYLS